MIELPIEKPELYQYSPHQNGMLLLDTVEAYDLDSVSLHSSVTVSPQSGFYNVHNNVIPIWVSFEYMAQNIAVLSGINYKIKGELPKIGFILSVTNFKTFKDSFNNGEKITISVQQEYREGDIAVFNGQSFVNQELYCSTTLTVIEASSELMDKFKN
ncbi:MAG: hypothetical protein OCD01_17705 [Fibrobacterales bacterium]